MAQGGMVGNGVKIAYSASSPVSWTSVGQILNAEVPQLVRDKIDRTVHSAFGYKRSLPGMIDVSDLTLTLLADLDATTGATQRALLNYLKAGTTIWWRIEIPVDRSQSEYAALEFQGFVMSWQPSAPIDGRQEVACTIAFDDTAVTLYAEGASAIS